LGRIVVGVDESPGAAAALRWAVGEADVRGWSLTAVLAWGFLDQHHATIGEPFDPTYGEVDAVAALESILTAAIGTAHTITIERTVVNDLPVAALLDASDGADLLVVGARGLGPVRRLLLGSVSQQCLHHATCSVAIVRDGIDQNDDRVARIVVGVDGSDTARHALQWALEAGRLHQASVNVVHAWDLPAIVGEPRLGVPFNSRSWEAYARKTLDGAVEAVDTSGLHAPLKRTLERGNAAAVLLQAADNADLVVVGSRGRGGFLGLLLGSVSHHLAHHANCPVVVLRKVQ
jgi:nucleotide-binding universal stress UspA family protein